jgi:hypothetical protein
MTPHRPYEPEECSIPIFDSDRNEPECIVCPVRDVCETDNAPVTITKDIRKRSGCDGDEFDTWDEYEP